MKRSECLQAMAPMLTDELVVTNVARTGFETHMAMPREGNLYTMGMGLVTPVVLGLALSLPHRGVIALDGDGSILLNLGALSTVGNYAPANLTAIIFDNESYASTGGLPTATAGKTKLDQMAKSAGITTPSRSGTSKISRLSSKRRWPAEVLGSSSPKWLPRSLRSSQS